MRASPLSIWYNRRRVSSKIIKKLLPSWRELFYIGGGQHIVHILVFLRGTQVFLLHAIRLFPRGYLDGCNYQFERDGQMVLVAEEVSALLGLCSLQALVPAPDIVK